MFSLCASLSLSRSNECDCLLYSSSFEKDLHPLDCLLAILEQTKSNSSVFSLLLFIFLPLYLSLCHWSPSSSVCSRTQVFFYSVFIPHRSRLSKLAHELKVCPDYELCCNVWFFPKHCLQPG